MEKEEYQKKLDILLLFVNLSIKSEYRFNKSKVNFLDNLVIFKTLLLMNMDEFCFVFLRNCYFFEAE